MKNSGIIIVGAAIAALLLFRKSEGEGGSGGSLSIPLDILNSGAEVAGARQPVPQFIPKKGTNTPSASSKVVGGSATWLSELAAIAKSGFSTKGISGSYDPSSDTIFTPSDRWGVGPGQKPPTLEQATSRNGIDWTAVSSKKANSGSSSGSSSSSTSSGSGTYNQGAGKVGSYSSGYAYSGSIGGWGV